MPERVWIDTMTARSLVAEADRKYPYETGGVVLGYRSAGHLVISATIGPGPLAIHHPNSFEPDAEYQQARIGEYYALDPARYSYLGDWHTHPDGPARLSSVDKRTLRTIAETRSARVQVPVMLLLSGRPASWETRVFEYRPFRTPKGIANALRKY